MDVLIQELYVLAVEHGAHKALDLQVIAPVRTGAVLSLISLPEVGFKMGTGAVECRVEPAVIADSHRPTNDLSSSRYKHVHRFGEAGILGTALHVQGLDLGRQSAQQDRLVDLVRHAPLGHRRNIVAKLVKRPIILGNVILLQVNDGIGIVDPHEGFFRRLKPRFSSVIRRPDLDLMTRLQTSTTRSSRRSKRSPYAMNGHSTWT